MTKMGRRSQVALGDGQREHAESSESSDLLRNVRWFDREWAERNRLINNYEKSDGNSKDGLETIRF